MVKVRASSPYVRHGTNVAMSNSFFLRLGILQFQTKRIFMYAVSATPSRCRNATSKGLLKEIMEPRYFTTSTTSTGSPEEKNTGSVCGVEDRISVFISFSLIPYPEASCSSPVRNACICGMVKDINKVSSAYSKSYVGRPTDHVLQGWPVRRRCSSRSVIISDKTITKRHGLSGHPCLMLGLTLPLAGTSDHDSIWKVARV